MGNYFVQNIDPLWFRLGTLGFRYYTVFFFCSVVAGYILWHWQVRRSGRKWSAAAQFIPWGIVALYVGARLGHCLLYQPGYFLSHPLEILMFWRGGLSSHGAAVGLGLAIVLYGRKKGMRSLEALDRLTFSAAFGAALIRLGNFFNSEVVGRATQVPWAVRFIRYDGGAAPRHPSQLYESAIGLIVLAASTFVIKL